MSAVDSKLQLTLAELYAEEHVSACASELLDLCNGGVVPEDGRLRKLIELCRQFYSTHPLIMAENLVKVAAFRKVSSG